MKKNEKFPFVTTAVAKSRDKNWKRNVILGIAIPLVVILFCVGVLGFAKHSSNVEEENLQEIVDEVILKRSGIKHERLYLTIGLSFI